MKVLSYNIDIYKAKTVPEYVFRKTGGGIRYPVKMYLR